MFGVLIVASFVVNTGRQTEGNNVGIARNVGVLFLFHSIKQHVNLSFFCNGYSVKIYKVPPLGDAGTQAGAGACTGQGGVSLPGGRASGRAAR